MILQIIWLWKDLKYLEDHVMLFDVKRKRKKPEKSNIVHLMANINKIRMRYSKTRRKNSIRMRIPRLPYPVVFLLGVVFPGGYTLSLPKGHGTKDTLPPRRSMVSEIFYHPLWTNTCENMTFPQLR